MKRLAGYVLEGLLVRGNERVWVDVKMVPTVDGLRDERAQLAVSRPEIVETRVTAFFLDSGAPEPARVRPAKMNLVVETLPTISA